MTSFLCFLNVAIINNSIFKCGKQFLVELSLKASISSSTHSCSLLDVGLPYVAPSPSVMCQVHLVSFISSDHLVEGRPLFLFTSHSCQFSIHFVRLFFHDLARWHPNSTLMLQSSHQYLQLSFSALSTRLFICYFLLFR